jgi:hypothetical protein
MRPTIYLAGPIFGATGAEANNWRHDMTSRFAKHGIQGISPLRCEPIVGDRYDTQYDDPCFGSPKAILSKNFLDLKACDFTLVYMPAPPEVAEMAVIVERFKTLADGVEQLIGPLDDDTQAINADAATLERIAKKGVQRSIGTLGELAWCKALGKPCALVTDDPLLLLHPFTKEQPDWLLSSLDEAERLIVGLYSDYVHPKPNDLYKEIADEAAERWLAMRDANGAPSGKFKL